MSRNNKYYMLQVIQEDKLYHFFRKWGRVGAKNPNVRKNLSFLCILKYMS
jgi:predicted DNA-binding WGR domain protein